MGYLEFCGQNSETLKTWLQFLSNKPSQLGAELEKPVKGSAKPAVQKGKLSPGERQGEAPHRPACQCAAILFLPSPPLLLLFFS